ncbi:hypothetical protein [Streptomyces sp. NPDC050804]|uniref:hypothetical protein n=1 Tax=Streptomyces sp. NPDC050804 TaxID=3154745 RepID=UPI00344649E6
MSEGWRESCRRKGSLYCGTTTRNRSEIQFEATRSTMPSASTEAMIRAVGLDGVAIRETTSVVVGVVDSVGCGVPVWTG